MIIDLSFNSKMNPQISSLFDEVAYSCRNNYNQFINSTSKSLIKDVDWWAENSSSRNTLASPLFYYFCCINFINKIFKENIYEVEVIYVDSLELRKIIKNLIKEYNKKIIIIYKPSLQLKVKIFLKKIFYYEYFFLKRLFQILLFKLSKIKSKNIKYKKPIILIDTFASNQFTNKDRWYGNFWEKIDSKLNESIYFVPSIINSNIFNTIIIFIKLRKQSRNNIIKEDFLKISDVFYSFMHKYRIKKLDINSYNYLNYDISGIIKEDLYNNLDIDSVYESILTYRFFYQISKSKINIKLSIDWFEGHSMDKLWNLGVKKFFPQTIRIGYESYVHFPYYLCAYPTLTEKEADVIPDIFAVQGEGCVKLIKEFLPTQKVFVAPAFRYEHIWNYKIKKSSSSKKKILVTFSSSFQTSVYILETLLDCFTNSKILNKDTEVTIKPHPTSTKKHIKKIKSKIKRNLPSSFHLTENLNFEELLKQSDILVTEASVTCLEAFVYGIPVIMVQNNYNLTYDPIPEDISKDLFRKCNSINQIEEAIICFNEYTSNQIEKNLKDGIEIRKNYFEPINKKGIYKFLNLI